MDNNCCSCIYDILNKILLLQKQDFEECNYVGCDKPYLGPVTNNICYNTRPIILYNTYTGAPWSFNITVNNETVASNILRVENCDDCCVTCRILNYDTETNKYNKTNDFVTLTTSSLGAIRCLSDTYIEL